MIELRTINTPRLPVQVLAGGEGADLGTCCTTPAASQRNTPS